MSMSHVVIGGSIVAGPDVWGNRFPVSRTFVELLTTSSYTPLGITWTDYLGRFSVVSANHSPGIPLTSLYLRLTRDATGIPYVPNPTLEFGTMNRVLRDPTEHFQLKTIETPWDPERPRVIAVWNGREFRYPWEFVRSLVTSIRGLGMGTGLNGSLQLIRLPDAPFLRVMEQNDPLFSVVERESKRTNTIKVSINPILSKTRQSLTERLAKAIAPALRLNPVKIRNSKDVFLTALEHFSDIRFNNWLLPSFNNSGLESAVGRVFGGPFPQFYGFEGRASFCSLVFAAAALDAGLKIRVTFATVGAAHITIIDVS